LAQSVDVQIVDDSGLPVTGLVAASFPAVNYSRAGSNADQSIALSNLSLITSPWAAGGLKERGQGVYRLDLPDAICAAPGHVRLRGEAGGKHLLCDTIDVGILSDQVPGTYESGTAGQALGRITGAQITTVAPVTQKGVVSLVAGDDYLAADGRALEWTDAGNTWPDLTGAAVAFQVADGELVAPGSVVTPSGPGKKVRVELTAAQTAVLKVRISDYDVRATLASGHKVTLVRSQVKVVDSEAS